MSTHSCYQQEHRYQIKLLFFICSPNSLFLIKKDSLSELLLTSCEWRMDPISIVSACITAVTNIAHLRGDINENNFELVRFASRIGNISILSSETILLQRALAQHELATLKLFLEEAEAFIRKHGPERTWYQRIKQVAFRKSYAEGLSSLNKRLNDIRDDLGLAIDISSEFQREEQFEELHMGLLGGICNVLQEMERLSKQEQLEILTQIQQSEQILKEQMQILYGRLPDKAELLAFQDRFASLDEKYFETVHLEVKNVNATVCDIKTITQSIGAKLDNQSDHNNVIKDSVHEASAEIQQLRIVLNDVMSTMRMEYKIINSASYFICYPNNEEKTVDNGGCILGFGNFGKTYQMKNKLDQANELFAVKRVNVDEAKQKGVTMSAVVHEANVLKRLEHNNIVKYWGSFYSSDKQYFHIVMEIVDGGSIAHHISSSSPLSLGVIYKWTRQIADALMYLHNKVHIIHRDIKPENILVTLSEGNIKIIDVGLSCVAYSSVAAFSKVGTSTYSSYEKAHGQLYTGADDVWAFGCVLLELLLQSRLADEMRNIGFPYAREKTVSTKLGQLLDRARQLDPNLSKLVTRMLAPEQEKRITSLEIYREIREPARIMRIQSYNSMNKSSYLRLIVMAAGIFFAALVVWLRYSHCLVNSVVITNSFSPKNTTEFSPKQNFTEVNDEISNITKNLHKDLYAVDVNIVGIIDTLIEKSITSLSTEVESSDSSEMMIDVKATTTIPPLLPTSQLQPPPTTTVEHIVEYVATELSTNNIHSSSPDKKHTQHQPMNNNIGQLSNSTGKSYSSYFLSLFYYLFVQAMYFFIIACALYYVSILAKSKSVQYSEEKRKLERLDKEVKEKDRLKREEMKEKYKKELEEKYKKESEEKYKKESEEKKMKEKKRILDEEAKRCETSWFASVFSPILHHPGTFRSFAANELELANIKPESYGHFKAYECCLNKNISSKGCKSGPFRHHSNRYCIDIKHRFSNNTISEAIMTFPIQLVLGNNIRTLKWECCKNTNRNAGGCKEGSRPSDCFWTDNMNF